MTDDKRTRLKQLCENSHLDAIQKLGKDPLEFEFAVQIAQLEKSEGGWKEDRRALYHSFEDFFPSRYEIVRFMLPYYFSLKHIDVARAMSQDRRPLLPLRYAIVTNPIRRLRAQAGDNLINDTCLIQIDLGLVRFCEYLARSMAISIRSLSALRDISKLHSQSDPLSLYDRLCRYIEIPSDSSGQTIYSADFIETDLLNLQAGSEAHIAFGALMQMMITFIVGHEAGHYQLGHVGNVALSDINPYDAFLRQFPIDPKYKIEHEADLIGILVLWDGMKNDGAFRNSIDFSALAPIIYMSSMFGYNHYVVQDSVAATLWDSRINIYIIKILTDMYNLKYENDRIVKLAQNISVLISSVTCWMGASFPVDTRAHVVELYAKYEESVNLMLSKLQIV